MSPHAAGAHVVRRRPVLVADGLMLDAVAIGVTLDGGPVQLDVVPSALPLKCGAGSRRQGPELRGEDHAGVESLTPFTACGSDVAVGESSESRFVWR
jgi:hypothetical protein